MTTQFFAHSPSQDPKPPPPVGWHALSEHLTVVAKLAEGFARETLRLNPEDAEEQRRFKESFHRAAYFAGLLHDLGKYRREFQEMIRGKHPRNERTRHKQAGAAKAADEKRRDIAFAIAGHHTSLPDGVGLKDMVERPGGRDIASAVWKDAEKEIPEIAQSFPAWAGAKDPLQFEFLVRLLLSCLVDADWQDTGVFKRRSRGLPDESAPPLLQPAARLEKVHEFIRRRAAKCKNPDLASIRHSILDAALVAASEKPGLFTMTVPTGGGKTLASLAFALQHAARHELRRVIYVAPYLTILEQNARVLRKALGVGLQDEFVFEHHSLANPNAPETEEADEEADEEAENRARRAENWAAPVVVTTNVQFFESLFDNRPGACRKLHNLAGSVIILDECQTLPLGLIVPTCSMLDQLTRTLGCSIVLCTATQPAWNRREKLPAGLEIIRETAPVDLDLFCLLERVQVEWPRTLDDVWEWPQVAGRMLQKTAALCIVNTRRAALDLCAELVRQGCSGFFHLSTTMCPTHRLRVLKEVRRRLKAGEPCRLVSTQLIEAGCDVDFPLVLREMAPLEAIIQSAGRCNREGKLPRGADGKPGGRVVVFQRQREKGDMPKEHWYENGRELVRTIRGATGNWPDIHQPAVMRDYYQRLYESGPLDEFKIQDLRKVFNFPAVHEQYRLIRDDTFSVVVTTWERYEAKIQNILKKLARRPSRRLRRQLTPFQVNLRHYEKAKAARSIDEHPSGMTLWKGAYDERFGLRLDGPLGDCVV